MIRLLVDTGSGPSLTWFTQGGALGIMAGVLLCLIKGWLVPGKQYDEVCEQRDKALEQVYKLADTASRAIEVAERKVDPKVGW